jgi:hypothetical protein
METVGLSTSPALPLQQSNSCGWSIRAEVSGEFDAIYPSTRGFLHYAIAKFVVARWFADVGQDVRRDPFLQRRRKHFQADGGL